MGLKILHTADWHLDSPFGSLEEGLREFLREQLRRIPDLIADLCIREKCDVVLLAGDIFDGPPTRQTLDDVKRALQRCGVPVLLSPGNHDFCGPDSPWMEPWPENVHIFAGDLTFVDLPELDCRIYGAGYRSMDCPGLLEDFHAEGDAKWCVAVLHGDPMTLSSPCCPVTAAQVRESGLDYLALGHIHRSGSFRAGNTLCAWPGCPMGRGWDETGEKGVFLAELDETARVRFVPLGLPEFAELTVSVSGDGGDALEAVLPPTESRNLYRVKLTGIGRVDVETLQKRFAHLSYLELRDETEEETDPWEYAGEDSLRGTYFRLLQEQLEEADPKQAQIIRAAAEISRRLLDGREVTLP